MNPAEQVKHAYQLEIRGWQKKYEAEKKKYEAEKKKNDIGSRAWNDVHRDLEAGQSAHEAERIKVESSERKASQLSEQVEELRSALQAKETEHNSFQDASTIRANDLIQQLNNSEIRLQSREQEVFELNNQLAACRTTIATKGQELTEAGNKLSGTQRKLSESEEQHRECRQTLKLRTTELVKLNQILKETRRTVDATFDRELTKIGDRQTAQESQVTTLEGRVAKEIITKDKEIDELKKEIITKDKEIDELKKEIISKDKETDELKKEIITKDKRIGELKEEIITKDKEIGELKMETASWKDENTRLRDNLSQEDAKKMEAEGFIVDMHGLTQFVSRPISTWVPFCHLLTFTYSISIKKNLSSTKKIMKRSRRPQ